MLCTHPSNEKSENHLGVALLLALKEFIFSMGITVAQQAPIETIILIRTNCWVEIMDLPESCGWKNSSGHKRRILVDKMGEFSWTLFTNSSGHFCPLEFLFWGDFSWTMFW